MPIYFDGRNEPTHPNYNPNWEKDGCGLKELEERKQQETKETQTAHIVQPPKN